MMLRLSPFVTAMKASACSMPADRSMSSSIPVPITVSPLNSGASRLKGHAAGVNDCHGVTVVIEDGRDTRADPAAAHDDNLQLRVSPYAGLSAFRLRMTTTSHEALRRT